MSLCVSLCPYVCVCVSLCSYVLQGTTEALVELAERENAELIEQQKIQLLEDELNEFFEMNKECNKQKVEAHRRRLEDIFHKSVRLLHF